MKTSEKTDKILAALFAVKKELVAVAKSSDNPFFKSKYADLNTHLDEAEPLLEKFGCMLLQPININPGLPDSVESRIIHIESGQWVSSEMSLLVAKNTMQDAGSAITYARRYTLAALPAMKAEDDDGEKAMVRPAQTKAPLTTTRQTAIETLKPEKVTEVTAKLPAEPFKKTTAFSKKKPAEAPPPSTAPTGSEAPKSEWN